MRKLVLAALVATAGLARATDAAPSAPTPGADRKPTDRTAETNVKKAAGDAKPAKKGTKAAEAKPTPPSTDAAKPQGATPDAAKPDAAKPCEPVKPCPIDG